MSDEDARKMLARIRDIMEETGLPFGPAVNVYINEVYGKAPETNLDRDSGVC